MKMHELEVEQIRKSGDKDPQRQVRLEAYRQMLQEAAERKEKEEDNAE